jgi:hypothetical protein
MVSTQASDHAMEAGVGQAYPDDICRACLGFLIADDLSGLPLLHAQVKEFLQLNPERNALGLYIISEQFVELFGCVTHLRGKLLESMASVYGLDGKRIAVSGMTPEDETELRTRGMDTDSCEKVSWIFGPTTSIQTPVCSFLDKVYGFSLRLRVRADSRDRAERCYGSGRPFHHGRCYQGQA